MDILSHLVVRFRLSLQSWSNGRTVAKSAVLSTASDQSHRTARIVAVVAGTLIALSCGTNYGFSAWGPQFAAKLELTATQTELIASFGNAGMYAVGIPGGILVDAKGPRYGVFLGSLSLALGYFPLKSAYDKGAGGTSMTWLCIFALLTGLGGSTAFTGALKACAMNWPDNRGTATAFPLSAFGLSALFYTTLASIIFPNDTSGYLLTLAVGTTMMTFVSMFFLSIPPPVVDYEPVSSRRNSNRGESYKMQRRGASVGASRKERESLDFDHTSEASSMVGSNEETMHSRPEISGFVLLRTPKFWRLFVVFSLLAGTGIMTINNIGNDVRSLWRAYDPSAPLATVQQSQLAHVSIISFFSFCGRLASGIGSDWLIARGLSRLWTLVVSASVFVVAQLFALVVTDPGSVFLISSLTGLAYGTLFGVFPALVADAFGPAGMGINWNCMTWAPMISGSVFNLIYGSILDENSSMHSDPNGGSGSEEACDAGKACYSPAYMITLGAAVFGVAWSLFCIKKERAEQNKDFGKGGV